MGLRWGFLTWLLKERCAWGGSGSEVSEKGLILSGRGGSWIATAPCDVAAAGGKEKGRGRREDRPARGSQGPAGTFAWRA